MIGEKSRLGIGIIVSAAFLGVIHDLLFQGSALGLNVPVAILADIVVLAFLLRWGGVELGRDFRWEIAAALIPAIGILLRDSPVLVALDLLAIGAILATCILRLGEVRLIAAGIADYLRGGLAVLADILIGAPRVAFREIAWKELAEDSWSKRLVSLGTGLLIGLPIILLLGGLLLSADPVFERLLGGLIEIDVQALSRHFGSSLLFAWVITGVFVGIIKPLPSLAEPGERTFYIGVVECLVVLVAVDLLFAAFVIVQLRYLFGGALMVGLSYAEYARHGFFELVSVTAIELPLLLAMDWAMGSGERRGRGAARLLSGLQILLLLVIVISALYRMSMYQAAYGQTELRFYTSAFMWWMGFLLLWFGVTVLRGRRRFFASGAVLSAFAVVVALNVLNPDAMIVAVNCERARDAGKRDVRYFDGDVDVNYLFSLSADAVPELVRQLPTLPVEDRDRLRSRLPMEWHGTDGVWGWNLSRDAARDAVASIRPEPREAVPMPQMIDEPEVLPGK